MTWHAKTFFSSMHQREFERKTGTSLLCLERRQGSNFQNSQIAKRKYERKLGKFTSLSNTRVTLRKSIYCTLNQQMLTRTSSGRYLNWAKPRCFFSYIDLVEWLQRISDLWCHICFNPSLDVRIVHSNHFPCWWVRCIVFLVGKACLFCNGQRKKEKKIVFARITV